MDADTDRGPVVPIAPDPERDARVDAYRDRERRRAARALDRYIEVVFEVTDPAAAPTGDALKMMTASERFVEQVGDYVLARLGERGDGHGPACERLHGVEHLHQKAHYGVGVTGVDIRSLCECGHPIGQSHFEHGCSRLIGEPPSVCECTRSLSSLLAPHSPDYGVPDHSAMQAALASAVMLHPTCQDVSALNEAPGTRWACTNECPR